MPLKRIISRLDIKGPNLVKGINLEGLRVLGKAKNFSNYYYKSGADEICYIDNVATVYGTNNLSKFITDTAIDVFIPLSIGGGIRKIDDMKNANFIYAVNSEKSARHFSFNKKIVYLLYRFFT